MRRLALPILPSLLLFYVFLLASVTSLSADEIQTDLDSDGKSDLTYVVIGSDNKKSLTWKSILSSTGIASNLGTFGVAGDHLILSRWLGLNTPQIGTVSLGTNNNILWEILDSQGNTKDAILGKKNDLAISGADFNGNGVADAAVARLVKKNAVWFVQPDMFVAASSPTKVRFGTSGDRAFFLNPDGVQDWIAVIGRAPNGRSRLRIRNFLTGEVKTFPRMPAFTTAIPRPRPFGLKQADGKDILAFPRASSRNVKVTFVTLDGQTLNTFVFNGTGDVIAGDFNTDPGEEVAMKTTSAFIVYNPNTQIAQQVPTQSGVAVDYINVNQVTGESGGIPSPTDPDDDDPGGTPPPSGAGCKSVKSWPGSHIYKTIGSEHFSDIRRNTIGVVVKPGGSGPFPQCIQALDTRGNPIANLGLYQTGNGWAARYYAGIGCGTSTPYNGSSVAARARAKTGSSGIFLNFGSVCYGPIDASRCIGSQQC